MYHVLTCPRCKRNYKVSPIDKSTQIACRDCNVIVPHSQIQLFQVIKKNGFKLSPLGWEQTKDNDPYPKNERLESKELSEENLTSFERRPFSLEGNSTQFIFLTSKEFEPLFEQLTN